MAEGNTLFPTALDTTTELPEPIGTDLMNVAAKLHGPFHKALSLAVKALEAKVGITSSATASSHDYKLANNQGNNLWGGQTMADQTRTLGTANVMRAVPWFQSGRLTFSKVRIRVGVVSGNISIAVYNSDGTSRLVTTGAVACPSPIGWTDVSIGSTTITPGKYFVALSVDNTTASFYSMGTYGVPGLTEVAASHPAPATFTPSAVGLTSAAPALILLP